MGQPGGAGQGDGTIFQIATTEPYPLTVWYRFCSLNDCADGGDPSDSLIQATDGNLYGTTFSGGAGYATGGLNGGGTIFSIDPAVQASYSLLYTFCSQAKNCPDGANPYGALVQATNGVLYGTADTQYGGSNAGTVFSLSVGLGPFVKTQTTSGAVGAPVTILGNNLTGATSVTFNGTAAVFTVNSTGTAISTTVPAGATSGTVQVVALSSGTLSSNVPFTVKQ